MNDRAVLAAAGTAAMTSVSAFSGNSAVSWKDQQHGLGTVYLTYWTAGHGRHEADFLRQ
ncbi:hypothetical protein [Streptomyces incanus]|uniref:Uncharacterized protein n=1 Tax=Streptomyces incanus TaxID=887453 RepID=A0ABW0XH49_9ACTN